MPRKPRVEYPGFHHLINRGVARGNIFLKEADFLKFLELLEQTSKVYNFKVHSLCLMTNHYHLLLETKSENLSLLARQINSKYAQYFNKGNHSAPQSNKVQKMLDSQQHDRTRSKRDLLSR